MKIKTIKYERGFIFKKDELTVISDEGKGRIKFKNKNTIKQLGQFKGLEVNSLNDLQKIDESIKNIDNELLSVVSLTILNSAKYPWAIIDKNAKQIPRPIISIFKKNKGIREFFILSLDANNFEAVINSGIEVQNILIKKLSGIKRSSDEELKEEDVLDNLKESVDEIFKDVNFDIRIGIRFDNFEGEYYVYHGKNFGKEEQYKYVNNLIGLYQLLYVENPFIENDTEEYKKLFNRYSSKCLITLNSKINEYTKAVNESLCNSIILRFLDLTDFKSNVDYFKDNKINIIGECKKELVNLLVGLNINLVKVDDLGNQENIQMFSETAEKIRDYLNSIKQE